MTMTEKNEALIAEARKWEREYEGCAVGECCGELADALEAATRERDAALEAIERVRAEADAYAEQPDVMEPCGAVAQALRAALDGAFPETGWEYQCTNSINTTDST